MLCHIIPSETRGSSFLLHKNLISVSFLPPERAKGWPIFVLKKGVHELMISLSYQLWDRTGMHLHGRYGSDHVCAL